MGVSRVWPPAGRAAVISQSTVQLQCSLTRRLSPRHAGAQWPPARCWPDPRSCMPGRHDVLAGANDGRHLVEES
eukprot:scaffold18649_cov71-Phaeocystis_antarctica.AAC.2